MALTGSTNAEKSWNYLKSKGLNNFAIAGLLGNIYAESGIIPNRVEVLCLNRLKENGKVYTDVTYTEAVDTGKISEADFLNPLPGKQYGYGLAQWTSPGRKKTLYNLVKSKNVSIGDLEIQLEFLWKELNESYKTVLSALKTANSVREASDVVLKKFECPANTSTSVQEKRASYGQKYYDTYVKTENNTGGNTMTEIELRKKVATWLDNYRGCAEGSAKHKEILAIFNNSRLCTRYTMTVNDAWCATAVSADFIACGLTDIFPCVECSCNNMIAKAKNAGIWVENDAYVPKIGDVILYDWQDSGSGDNVGSADHVGIVYSISGNTFTVIEGNYSNTVKVRTLTVNQRYIRGYITPKYSTKATDSSTPTTPSTPNPPTGSNSEVLNKTVKWNGIVIATELNVRTWAGTENKLCSFSPLKKNATVGVCDSKKADDGSVWYYIKYNNKYGFVHSSYVRSSSSSTGSTATSSSKVETANNFDKSLAGTYKVIAKDGLNLRVGAGTGKSKILTIPYGDKVTCYGYYNISGNVKWYYVAYKTYTGYVSSEYLKK